MPTHKIHRIVGGTLIANAGQVELPNEDGEGTHAVDAIEVTMDDKAGNLYTILVTRETWEKIYAESHSGIVVPGPAMAASIKTRGR